MTDPAERVSDKVLQDIVKNRGNAMLLFGVEMARELISRRRGKWICARCLLRQEPTQDSDRGIPW
jgi:hypothetical protein